MRHGAPQDNADSPGAPRVLGVNRTQQQRGTQPLPGGGPADVGLVLAPGQNNQHIAVSVRCPLICSASVAR
jgi:hypothetical protein